MADNSKASKNSKTTKDAAMIVASKAHVKVIVPIKDSDGNISFKEQMMHKDNVQEFLKKYEESQ